MKIRKAVGAVILKGEEVLLIYKIKSMSMDKKIRGHWDLPKGGVKDEEELEEAILRELKEETGSSNYRVVKKLEKEIGFKFPEGHKYNEQITYMFLVEYLGDGGELQGDGNEIDKLQFIELDKLDEYVKLEETGEFINEIRGDKDVQDICSRRQ